MKNKIFWFSLFLVFSSFLVFWCFISRNYKTIEINNKKFYVELAQTSEEKSQGLSQRKNIRNNGGMLFIFSESADYLFWMKEMRFDLDIIWIDKGRIAYIKKNVPHDFLEAINPEVRADQVLEIKSGLSDKYNFKIGDEVKVY